MFIKLIKLIVSLYSFLFIIKFGSCNDDGDDCDDGDVCDDSDGDDDNAEILALINLYISVSSLFIIFINLTF